MHVLKETHNLTTFIFLEIITDVPYTDPAKSLSDTHLHTDSSPSEPLEGINLKNQAISVSADRNACPNIITSHCRYIPHAANKAFDGNCR